MKTIRYTGEAGLMRVDDRPLQPGDTVVIPDSELEGHLALGRHDESETPGVFEDVTPADQEPDPVAPTTTETEKE